MKLAGFVKRVEKFVLVNTCEESLVEDSIAPIMPAPPGDGYLLARQFFWFPILKLRSGETYRLHISSTDFQHGFCLLPMNMNFQIFRRRNFS